MRLREIREHWVHLEIRKGFIFNWIQSKEFLSIKFLIFKWNAVSQNRNRFKRQFSRSPWGLQSFLSILFWSLRVRSETIVSYNCNVIVTTPLHYITLHYDCNSFVRIFFYNCDNFWTVVTPPLHYNFQFWAVVIYNLLQMYVSERTLSDLVSENRVRFERSIKKYFHIPEKSVENWHLLFWKCFFKKNFFLRIV